MEMWEGGGTIWNVSGSTNADPTPIKSPKQTTFEAVVPTEDRVNRKAFELHVNGGPNHTIPFSFYINAIFPEQCACMIKAQALVAKEIHDVEIKAQVEDERDFTERYE